MPKKKQVSIHEAKTHLSKLIQEALSGVEITIAKGQKPLIRFVVIDEQDESKAFKVLGKFDNTFKIPEDFDVPLDDMKDYQ